jgi:hypothetical protein
MKDVAIEVEAGGPAKEPAVAAVRGKCYLYAIAPAEKRSYASLGICGNDVYAIIEGRVAAIVSGAPNSKIRPERAHLAAHQAVLKKLMTETTVLPITFGTIAANPEAIRKILLRNQSLLRSQLERVAGKVEMGLRVTWDVPNIFEYFVNTHAELRLVRDHIVGARGEPSQEERIELGRMFERLLTEDRENYVGKVERVLKSECFEVKSNSCRNEREVMVLACLVGRDAQKQFDAAVFDAAELFDNHFAFDYNGPWAPHNFVDIDLEH